MNMFSNAKCNMGSNEGLLQNDYTLPQKVQTHKYTVRGESRAKKVIVGAIYESAILYTL